MRNRVREFRQNSGITQAELAERIGVWRQTIVAIEKGDNPRVEIAIRLAKELDTIVEDLFILKETSTSKPSGSSGVNDAEWLEDLLLPSATNVLRLPVSSEMADDFFQILFKYIREVGLLRVMYYAFGSEFFLTFLSHSLGKNLRIPKEFFWEMRFRDVHIRMTHGENLRIPKRFPKRFYWDMKFRDVHINMTLRAISKRSEIERWRHSVASLSKTYGKSPKRIVQIFKRVEKSQETGNATVT